MVNPWCKYKRAPKSKKQALHSLVAGLAFLGGAYLFTRLVSVPLCPIRNLFEVPCPGCGLTRAFLAILRFDFQGAIEYHALSIPLFLGMLSYACLCISDILLERDDLKTVERFCKKPCLLVLLFGGFVLFLYTRYH